MSTRLVLTPLVATTRRSSAMFGARSNGFVPGSLIAAMFIAGGTSSPL